MTPTHGGPDAHAAARFDFSTNSNAAGPCAPALQALRQADLTRYPDPAHTAVCEALAAWHGVVPARIVIAASASEFIQRFTAVSTRLAPGAVALPMHAYGDCARAAAACGREVVRADDPQATLRWYCDPSSPLGVDDPPAAAAQHAPRATVLDAVYAPLRLQGRSAWDAAAQAAVFRLHSPNKALGLTGVRAAYAVAPAGEQWQPWLQALQAAAPSWPLGADGVALLSAWPSAAVQQWLAGTLATLREWKVLQTSALQALDIEVHDSVTPFFCARLGVPLHELRALGVQVRDTTSFGLPGWARLSVQPPLAQEALMNALRGLRMA